MPAESVQATPVTAGASAAWYAPGAWPEAVRIDGECFDRQAWEVRDGDMTGVMYELPTASTSVVIWRDLSAA